MARRSSSAAGCSGAAGRRSRPDAGVEAGVCRGLPALAQPFQADPIAGTLPSRGTLSGRAKRSGGRRGGWSRRPAWPAGRRTPVRRRGPPGSAGACLERPGGHVEVRRATSSPLGARSERRAPAASARHQRALRLGAGGHVDGRRRGLRPLSARPAVLHDGVRGASAGEPGAGPLGPAGRLSRQGRSTYTRRPSNERSAARGAVGIRQEGV